MHPNLLKCIINQTHKIFFPFCLRSIRIRLIRYLFQLSMPCWKWCAVHQLRGHGLFSWLLPIFFDFARLINCNDFCLVNGTIKNTTNERSIPNGPLAWDFMILFSYVRIEQTCDPKQISQNEERPKSGDAEGMSNQTVILVRPDKAGLESTLDGKKLLMS